MVPLQLTVPRALNPPPLHQQMMMATTFELSSVGEKNLYHPKFKVDDMVLAELMDMKISLLQ
jgi:hypothetical protein